MENFIPSLPSPAGFTAPSGALGSASPSPDAAGSSAGVFQLLMNSCLAQAAGAGEAAGAAVQASGPAEEDAKADGKADGKQDGSDGGEILSADGMIPAGLIVAEPPSIAQAAAPVPVEGVSPEASATGFPEVPAGNPAVAPANVASTAGIPAAGPAAAAPQESISAFGNLLAEADPAPAAQSQAASGTTEMAADAPAVAGKDVPADVPAPRAADAAVANAADASAVAGKKAPADAPAPRAADAAVANAADASAVAGKEVPAEKPEPTAVGEKKTAAEDRPAPASREARGLELSAAVDDKTSLASGEGEFSRRHEAAEPVRFEGATGAAEPAGPGASQTAASARNTAETPFSARLAGNGQAAPAQREFQVGENAFVLTRKSDTSLEVTLSPPGIGKLEIEVVLEKGVINANITAADPAGREAIERSLPQIVQALANEGVAIGGFTVSLKGGRDPEGNAGSAGKGPENGSAAAATPAAVRSASAQAGLVDIFV